MRAPSAWIDVVPPELCSQEDKHAVAHLLANLPPCSRDIGLEADLSRPAHLYAVGLAIKRDDECTRTLLPGGKDFRLHKLAVRSAVWRRLSAFVLAWLHLRARALGSRVPFFFLEFDHRPNWEYAPCTFVALDWPLAELEPRFRQQAPLAVPGFQAVLELLVLLGNRAQPLEVARLVQCWQQLPEGGVWSHVGVLSSRPGAGRRVSLLLPRGAVAAYLERVVPTANSARVGQILQRYATFCHCDTGGKRVQLELDVGETFSGRVGLSLLPNESGGWPALLGVLVRDGLCDPRAAQAAMSWSRGTLTPGGDGSSSVRYLSHVKLVVQGMHPTSAKLYMGLRHPPSW